MAFCNNDIESKKRSAVGVAALAVNLFTKPLNSDCDMANWRLPW